MLEVTEEEAFLALVPRRQKRDILRDMVTGTVGSVPVFGGLAGSLMREAWASHYDQRISNLLAAVLRRLDHIEEQFEDLPNSELSTREPVLTDAELTVIGLAARESMTADDEKIDYLANAIFNVLVDETLSHDLVATLMEHVARATATHIRVLEAQVDPEGWLKRTGRKIRPLRQDPGGDYHLVDTIAQALGYDPNDDRQWRTLDIIVDDLQLQGLMTLPGVFGNTHPDRPVKLKPSRVSPAGRALIGLVRYGPLYLELAESG